MNDLEKHCDELEEIIHALLEYIDAIPSDVANSFPAMPGISRDYIEPVLDRRKNARNNGTS